MFVIGLTGGIASGKTSVAERFAALGARIIDTDRIARELVAPGQEALREIVAHFGEQVLRADGQLNRPWLRQRIFTIDAERAALNAIMHPRIRAEVDARLNAIRTRDDAYAIVVIPLLVETGGYDALLDRVLLVDLPEDIQLARLMRREGIDRAQARAVLDAQATRAQRLARADEVIDNSGPAEALPPQVARLHAHYSALAARHD